MFGVKASLIRDLEEARRKGEADHLTLTYEFRLARAG